MTRDADRAARVRRLSNHGAERKYHHLEVGFNSRLDGLQAALLNVKLTHWEDLIARRRAAAARYDALLDDVAFTDVIRPARAAHSTHTVGGIGGSEPWGG